MNSVFTGSLFGSASLSLLRSSLLRPPRFPLFSLSNISKFVLEIEKKKNTVKIVKYEVFVVLCNACTELTKITWLRLNGCRKCSNYVFSAHDCVNSWP